mmetsp:Transcript_44969/g.143191  ORF Transcript_44969/g.143191 Transcript_44969/m.143191 type:complete len:224 (-) Transcript_44969:83-754(-)
MFFIDNLGLLDASLGDVNHLVLDFVLVVELLRLGGEAAPGVHQFPSDVVLLVDVLRLGHCHVGRVANGPRRVAPGSGLGGGVCSRPRPGHGQDRPRQEEPYASTHCGRPPEHLHPSCLLSALVKLPSHLRAGLRHARSACHRLHLLHLRVGGEGVGAAGVLLDLCLGIGVLRPLGELGSCQAVVLDRIGRVPLHVVVHGQGRHLHRLRVHHLSLSLSFSLSGG